MKRAAIAATAALCVVAAGIGWAKYHAHRLDNLNMELLQVYRACDHYARDHAGELPVSIQSLVDANYLCRRQVDGAARCFGPPERQDEIFPVHDRRPINPARYRIGKAGNLADFNAEDNQPVDSNGVPVMFVVPARSELVPRAAEYTARLINRRRSPALRSNR